jgi:LCP family protein required for cell wall assembly
MAKKIKKDTILTVVGLIITVCAFAGAIFAVTRMISKPKDDTEMTTYSKQNNNASTLYFDGKNYKIRDNMEVILIMGIDDREDIGSSQFAIHNSQADVLYVYAVDHKNKTYQAIQLNRETMTGIQTYNADGTKDTIAEAQICLAHSFGKTEQGRCLNTVDAVSGLLFNMKVDHYISLKMDAISILNEQVGGVTVTVPAGLESADPAFKEGAKVKLQGNQAEAFVRSRMSLENDTNEFRMERQQIFMKAWMEQASAKMDSDSGFALGLVLSLSDYMTSDMSANALSDLANKLKEYKNLGTVKTVGETLLENEAKISAFREYYVDSDDLERKVIELFYEEKPTGSEG